METRFITFESRADKDKVSGYAVKWNTEARIGNFTESFDRGSLKPDNNGVGLKLMHNPLSLLGRSGANLEIEDRAEGLHIQARLPATTEGNNTKELIRTGIVRGFSVGFVPIKEDWNGNKRTIKQARLIEISLVDSPAHKDTQVDLRNKQPSKKRWQYLILEA